MEEKEGPRSLDRRGDADRGRGPKPGEDDFGRPAAPLGGDGAAVLGASGQNLTAKRAPPVWAV